MENTPTGSKSSFHFDFTELRTEIIDHYKGNGCCTTAVPALLDGEEVHIDKIFVMPSMMVRKNAVTGNSFQGRSEVTQFTRTTEGSITTIQEIFQKDGQSIRQVCISGDAGQGKTTLCQRIVSTWCKVHANNKNEADTDHQFLKSFDLLFYLPLRNQKKSDVIEMIETNIVRKALHNGLKEVLEKESAKCLIILDGLDEWFPSKKYKHKLPFIDPREKFTVLHTSRPWKLEVLRPNMSELGQEVQLNGIKNDKLIKAVVNLLNNKYAKNRNWEDFKYTIARSYVQNEKYKKVKHLADIPIILTQMVCMWYDEETFGNTRIEIYSTMLDYLFHAANERRPDMFNLARMRPQRSTNKQLTNVFKDFKFCEMYSEILCKLSDLAYHSLFNEEKENTLVFPHSFTEIYRLAENDVNLCLFVGILSQTKCLSKASSHTKSVSFLHKTFQEFFAALYIAYGGKDRSFTAMLEPLKSLDDVFEMSQVLIFLSGLRPDLVGDISRHTAQLSDKDERVLQYRNTSMRFHEHEHIIIRLQELIYDCIVEVTEHGMLETKVELHDVIYHCLINKPTTMMTYLNHENIKSWNEGSWLGRSSDWIKPDLTLVNLHVYIESQEHIDYVTRIVERCATSLTCLSVDNIQLRARIKSVVLENMNKFLKALHTVRHLTCFTLGNVNLTHSEIEYLGTILSKSTHLREFALQCIGCTTCRQGQCHYNIDLSNHKQLQYVGLYGLDGDIVLGNEVPVERCEIYDVNCAPSILDILKSSKSLQELYLHGNRGDVSPNSITSSTTTVQDAESVVHPTSLCLSRILTDVIPTFKNLRTLNLRNIDFKQDILKFSPGLTSLKFVFVHSSTMTLQCLQGCIDSLPKRLHGCIDSLPQCYVSMKNISICPQEDMSKALKYMTDRHQDSNAMTEDGFLEFELFN